MICSTSTLAAIALTHEGLLLASDSRRRVGEVVCDGVEKLHALDCAEGVFVVAGLECAAERLTSQRKDPCEGFEAAEKCYDLRRVVRSVVSRGPLTVALVAELCHSMVAEAAALEAVRVQAIPKPLASVVVAMFDNGTRTASLALINIGASDDGRVRFTDLRAHLLTLSSKGLQTNRGSALDPGSLCFGDLPYLAKAAPDELERIRQVQRRVESATADDFEAAVESLVRSVSPRTDSPVGGSIQSILINESVQRRKR